MKELVMEALDKAFQDTEAKVPQQKPSIASEDITDIKPYDLNDFMVKNNIPKDAYFDCHNNHDPFQSDSVLLSWEVMIPTTSKEKDEFRRRNFSSNVSSYVYKALVEHNIDSKVKYKRVGFGSDLLKQFKDSSVYDMYISKDYDRLTEYYSLYFQEVKSND